MIWIIGGGPKSYQLCQRLNELKKEYKLTTITDYKRDMPLSYTSRALRQPLSAQEIQEFIIKEKVKVVIDHSYGNGSSFSKELMKVCDMNYIDYVRYEEASLLDKINNSHIEVIKDIEEIISLLKDYKKPIFLDINRKLKKEIQNLNLENCFYRNEIEVLDVESLEEIVKLRQITMILACENEVLPIYNTVCNCLDMPLVIVKKNRIKYKNRYTNLKALEEYLIIN